MADTELSASMLINAACFVVAAWIGSWFPDTDLKVRFLRHRSVLTHGILVPLMFVAMVGVTRTERVEWFVAGLCTGLAVHLAFDLFPKGWNGYAFISVPGLGVMPASVSIAWMLTSTALCMVGSIQLVQGMFGLYLWAVSMAAMLLSGVFTQGERLIGPLIVLAVTGSAAVWLREGGVDLMQAVRY